MKAPKVKIDKQFGALMPLSDTELAALEESLLAEGCRDPLVVWSTDGGDVLLDGHNRYAICDRHGIKFQVVAVDIEDRGSALRWIVRNQLARRNLNESQRAMIAARLATLAEGRPKKTSPIGEVSQADAAELLNVGKRSVERARYVQEHGTPEIVAQVDSGELPVSRAYDGLRLAMPTDRPPADPPTGRYSILLADPPWRYDYSETTTRKVENQYPTMELEAIKALPVVAEIRGQDAVLFLWTTSPKLPEGLAVMEAWGFTYRTCMVWVKDKIGMGYYARQRHELLLIGSTGKLPVPEASDRPDSVIEAPRGRHSEKPGVVYELIDRMYPGRRKVELFARAERKGWSRWGNEA